MAHTGKIGRNELCSCGSGKKFKKCHGLTEPRSRANIMMFVLIGTLVIAGLAAAASSFTTDISHTAKSTGVWSAEHGHYH
ncbi:MAG TPA: SEC-C metal-binding domain-containing protein [Vicinamibacterales bacterium]|nr:SEC-C metal-binding domain-containing protein [Vicinamibacterales bacterium]